MLGNKVKRNIWLTLFVFALVAVVDRAVRVADGRLEWWNLISVFVIAAFCGKFYLCYRRQVRKGNLFGRVKVL